MEKNDYYEVDILDTGYEGEGIAKIDGYTTFIKGAIKGEKVKIKMLKTNKDFGFAKLEEIIKKSDNREEPICEAFDKCGGCSLQHMSYESQLDFKTNLVKATLKKQLGYEPVVENIIGMGVPYNYRNKAQYPVTNGKIGFYAERSHLLIENKKCYIQNALTDKMAKDAFEITQKYNVPAYDEKTGKGFLRHIVTKVAVNTNESMLMFITNGEKFKDSEKIVKDILELYPALTSIVQNVNTENGNVILGEKCINLYGKTYIVDELAGYKFKISPLSFYQVNPIQTEILYNIAKDYAKFNGSENVFDLYCGIGTISIFIADSVKTVFGVEVVEDAIKDAKENAEMNKKKNIEFEVGEVETVIPKMYKEGKTANIIFVDPPRKGCDEKLLETIKDMEAEKVIYISCNPATLARDLKYLTDNGYEIKKIQPVDMFPQTSHVETVCLLERK